MMFNTIKAAGLGDPTSVAVEEILARVLGELYPPPTPWPAVLAKRGFAGLDKLVRERLRELGDSYTFTAADYERELRRVILDLLDTSRKELESSGVPQAAVAGASIVEEAEHAMRMDGINPAAASAEVVSSYYCRAQAEQEVEPEPELVDGEDQVALAEVICGQRNWDPTDPTRFSAALQEVEKLQVRGRELREAKRIVARGWR